MKFGVGLVCGWCFGGWFISFLFWLVGICLVWFFVYKTHSRQFSLFLQGSDLLYEVEVPGPPTVLALSNGNGGKQDFEYTHK